MLLQRRQATLLLFEYVCSPRGSSNNDKVCIDFSYGCPIMPSRTRYDLTRGSLSLQRALRPESTRGQPGTFGFCIRTNRYRASCWTIFIAPPLSPYGPDELGKLPRCANAGVVGTPLGLDFTIVTAKRVRGPEGPAPPLR